MSNENFMEAVMIYKDTKNISLTDAINKVKTEYRFLYKRLHRRRTSRCNIRLLYG